MNDLSQITMLLVFEIFRTSLFLATHSETDCSSLLNSDFTRCRNDVYSVESSAYIALLNGMSLVKIEISKGPRQLPRGIPDFTRIMLERLPLKNTLCVLLDRELFIHNIAGGVKP